MNRLTKLFTYLSLTNALVLLASTLQNSQHNLQIPLFESNTVQTTQILPEATQESPDLYARTVNHYPPNDSVVHQTYRYPNTALWRETTQTYTNGIMTMNTLRTYCYDENDLTAIIDSVYFSDAQEVPHITTYFKDRTEVYINGERKTFNKSIL